MTRKLQKKQIMKGHSKGAVIIYGLGAVKKGGGKNFSASKLRGGKISVRGCQGGGANFDRAGFWTSTTPHP